MVNDFMSWLKNPLNTSSGAPSGWNLFLTIGLILVFMGAWGIVFRHVRAALD